MYDAFHPGKVWLDDQGQRIQAHGGSLFFENDTYYWYGEDKSRTTPDRSVWHMGVRLYSSKDLYNWHDEGTILAPVPDDRESPLHPSRILDRPHVIFCQKTGKYVMWVKFAGTVEKPDDWMCQYMGVAVADAITGPFTLVKTLHPCGMNSGDFDLCVNPSDQKAYIIFERVHTNLVVADLTDDYMGVTGHYSEHFAYGQPPFVREAPAFFRRGAEMYLLTSGTTGYMPNPSETATSRLIHGPWTVQGDPCVNDITKTSFDAQFASVFKHPKKKNLYIALGDSWVPALARIAPQDRPDIVGYYARVFSGADMTNIPNPEANIPTETREANYTWLPITFEEGKPRIEFRETWRAEAFE